MWRFKETGGGCVHLLLVAGLLALGRCDRNEQLVAVNELPDGEVETRVLFQGVSAKEVSVGRGSPTDIKFRQLADRNHLIQLIYNDGEELKDCEIIHHRDQVRKFLHSFKSDLSNLIATSNVTIESLDNKQLPEDISTWFNTTKMRNACRKLHHQMKKQALENRQTDRSEDRRKRSILIVPGTLWCGNDHDANRYTQLGAMSNTDKCCRRHDHCKRNIPGFTTKFHYHNYSPFTLSHCYCDSSFRACLKMVDTSDANLVGKLFFNVVQTKCFVIKPKKVCVRSSWWGQCQKYKHVKQAILRDNLPY
jgi:secretory phospholipase A2